MPSRYAQGKYRHLGLRGLTWAFLALLSNTGLGTPLVMLHPFDIHEHTTHDIDAGGAYPDIDAKALETRDKAEFGSRTARIAIIIDDLGYQWERDQKIVELSYPLTLAIIPFTPYGKRLAALGHSRNHEIMLHAPMETLGATTWEDGLTSRMSQQEMLTMSAKMLADIPYIKGVNNHGGSKLTQTQPHMDWLMTLLSEQELFFIDSRTSAASVALATAKSHGVATAKRDVFLDNQRDVSAIEQQLVKLEMIARKRGIAVGIGHPYPETLAALQSTLPQLERAGIELVYVSELLFPNLRTVNALPHQSLSPAISEEDIQDNMPSKL
ncbi:divergent polysaccharide deacetylase family protein [Teredinibacter waterburyi]|uniref:divergent polysaccharide deacetylase family protein n=1 Tax=Teredinibacter waterburyi TaxID=1500538 RepID=UPI00165F1472|nr:divergent polysaccharide deacetylase family protein [Teredinibacter waterburyi]